MSSGRVGLLCFWRRADVFDPAPETATRCYVDKTWPAREELRLTERATPDALCFVSTAADAVDGAAFVQENVPERKTIKRATYEV